MRLPNEILIKIFNNVEITTLIKLSETCKRFYEIVTSNKKLHERLYLKIDYADSWNSEDATKVDESQLTAIVESQRKFSKICIQSLKSERDQEHLLKLIEGFSWHIKTIAFKNCDFHKSFQHKVFSGMNNVDSVVCRRFPLNSVDAEDDSAEDSQKLVAFPQLNILVTNDGSFFKKAENLKDLCLFHTLPQDLPWICQQKALHKLQLYFDQASSPASFHSEMEKVTEIPSRLEHLMINTTSNKVFMLDKLERLFTSQSRLHTLELMQTIKMTEQQIKMILTQNSLVNLELSFHRVVPNSEIFEKSYPNITFLGLRFCSPNLLAIQKFVYLFPNLERLTLELCGWPGGEYDYRTRVDLDEMQHLKSVSCHLINSMFSAVLLNFSQMRKVIINQNTLDTYILRTMVLNNPNIEDVHVLNCKMEFKDVEVVVNGLMTLTEVVCGINERFAWERKSFEYLLENSIYLEKVVVILHGTREEYTDLLEKYKDIIVNSTVMFTIN